MVQATKYIFIALGIAVLGWIGWQVFQKLQTQQPSISKKTESLPVPVEVAAVTRASIELRRTFSGTLEARAKFVVAPKIGGRVERMLADLADMVKQDQVVAQLDDDEFVLSVAQAQADLAVAKAQVVEAKNALQIAERELSRIQSLLERGVSSASELDTAVANQLARQATLEVSHAHVTRAEAALEAAKTRLAYTRITVHWTGADSQRVVAERFVDEGETVTANTPLISIVSLHPINAIVYATEKDYGRLQTGQKVALLTDSFPKQRFLGRIVRISPIFRQASRQARVEIEVDNSAHLLKPGMFVRAEVVLDKADNVTIVPIEALVTREGKTGVFVVDPSGQTVFWKTVETKIQEGSRVQVVGSGIEDRVVTLGQQLVQDGSRITIPTNNPPPQEDGRNP